MSSFIYEASDFDGEPMQVWSKRRRPPGFVREPEPHLSFTASRVWLTSAQVERLICALQAWLDRQGGDK